MSEIISAEELSRLRTTLEDLTTEIKEVIEKREKFELSSELRGDVKSLTMEISNAAKSMDILASMVDRALSSHRAAFLLKDNLREPLRQLVSTMKRASDVSRKLLGGTQ